MPRGRTRKEGKGKAGVTPRQYIRIVTAEVKRRNGEARIHPEGDAVFVELPDRIHFWVQGESSDKDEKIVLSEFCKWLDQGK